MLEGKELHPRMNLQRTLLKHAANQLNYRNCKKQVAELESWLSEKEAKITDDLLTSLIVFLISFSKILIFLAVMV